MPSLAQVMRAMWTPGWDAAVSGVILTSRGSPSSRAASASLRAVGPMHPPPTHPSMLPSGKTIALSPDARRGRGLGADDRDEGEGALAACASSPARRSESARRARWLGSGVAFQASTPFSRRRLQILFGVSGMSTWRTP